MVSKDVIMKIDEQYLTETNAQILLGHKKKTGEQVYIGVIQNNMDQVILMINNVGNSENKERDLLEIATHILGVITWKQPFMDGNRRTGVVAADKFLRDNGHHLDVNIEEKNLELRTILKMLKNQLLTLNQEVMTQLSFYISQRIVQHEPRR